MNDSIGSHLRVLKNIPISFILCLIICFIASYDYLVTSFAFMLPCYATTPSGMTTMNIIKFGFALSLTNACLGVSLIATNTYDIPMQCLTSMISKILPIVQISFDVEKQISN